MPLNSPTPTTIARRVREFDDDPASKAYADTLALVFGQWPNNTDLAHVLAKVTLLDRLFSTHVYNVHKMAEHIRSSEIDGPLGRGELAVVDTIADAPGGRRRYSFATKYCAWHRPDDFQVYDGRVDEALWRYRNKHGFSDFKRGDLLDYPTFMGIVDSFRRHFGLDGVSRRDLDRFLWSNGGAKGEPEAG